MCLKDIDFDNLPSDLGFYVVNTIIATAEEVAELKEVEEEEKHAKQPQEEEPQQKLFDEVFSELDDLIKKDKELEEVKARLEEAENRLKGSEEKGLELALLRNKVQEMETQHHDTEAVEANNEEIERLKEQVEGLANELKDKELSIANREKEVNELKRAVAAKEDEARSAAQKKNEVEALLESEREAKDFYLAEERMKFSMELGRLHEEVNSLRAKNEELLQQGSEKEELQQPAKVNDSQLEEEAKKEDEDKSKNEDIARLRAELGEKEALLSKLQEKVDASYEIVKGKDAVIEGKTADVEAAEVKAKEMEETVRNLERRLSEREQAVSGETERSTQEIRSLEEKSKAAARELGQTKLLLEFREREIDMLKKETKSKMDDGEKERQKLKEDLEARIADYEGLNRQLSQAQQTEQLAATSNAEAERKIAELTAALAETQENLKKTKENSKSFQAATLKAKEEMERALQEEFLRVKQDIDTKMVMAKELRVVHDQRLAEVSELREALQSKEAELKELKEKTDLELKGCEEVRIQMEEMVVSKTLELQSVLERQQQGQHRHNNNNNDEFVILGTESDKKRIVALEGQLQQLEARKDRRIVELEDMVRDKATKLESASRLLEKTLKESEQQTTNLEEKSSQALAAKERLEAQIRYMETRHAEQVRKYTDEIKQLEGTIGTQVEQVAILKKLVAALQSK